MGFKSKRKFKRGGSRGPKPFDYKAFQRKQKDLAAIRPDQLVKKAIPLEEAKYKGDRTFEQMPIEASLKANLSKKGFIDPTEIQDKTFELVEGGTNLLGIAKTGTGKTGAFLLPLINRFIKSPEKRLKLLVMVPTRELAIQVEGEFKWMGENLDLKSSCFIGGTPIHRDLKALKNGANDVVVGTPGRLLDLSNRKALNLNHFEVLILDEFDRMLDMGFSEDVKRISSRMQKREQTLLFSATVDKTQRQIIESLMPQRKEVRVSTGEATADHIDQDVIVVPEGGNKISILVKMLDNGQFYKVLIFCETKRGVHNLTKRLKKYDIKADEIHGDKSQAQRVRALDKFKSGKIQVLVATDVASRGLDVSDVTHVINYQMPQNYDSYIHRIGRTGRAGKGGKAFTFVTKDLVKGLK